MAGLFALLALALVCILIFVFKMVSVPLAIAAEADSRRVSVESELGQRLAALEAKQADQRDPDGIYQLGARVATAANANIVRRQGVVRFGALLDAHDLNLTCPFEYREFEVQTIGAGDVSMVQMGNQKPDRTIPTVVARIIGLRS